MAHAVHSNCLRARPALTARHDAGLSAETSLTAWRQRCHDLIGPLFRTERAATVFPCDQEPITVQHESMAAAASAWLAYYHKFDTALTSSPRAINLGVFHLSDLYNFDLLKPSEFWHDWIVPHHVMNGVGLAIRVNEGNVPATLHAYPDRAVSPRRGRSILRLLRPAFEAGVRAAAASIADRTDVLRGLETGSEGLILFDLDGQQRYVSPRVSELLSDPRDGLALTVATKRVARNLIALVRESGKSHHLEAAIVGHCLSAQAGDHHVHGLIINRFAANGDPQAVVMVRRPQIAIPDDTILRARFGLTDRECAVAHEIAAGYSSQEIADRLVITIHTVRRHAERIFSKLGVKSRAAVAGRLTGAVATP